MTAVFEPVTPAIDAHPIHVLSEEVVRSLGHAEAFLRRISQELGADIYGEIIRLTKEFWSNCDAVGSDKFLDDVYTLLTRGVGPDDQMKALRILRAFEVYLPSSYSGLRFVVEPAVSVNAFGEVVKISETTKGFCTFFDPSSTTKARLWGFTVTGRVRDRGDRREIEERFSETFRSVFGTIILWIRFDQRDRNNGFHVVMREPASLDGTAPPRSRCDGRYRLGWFVYEYCERRRMYYVDERWNTVV